jgi:hypothetical protein
VAWWAWLLLVWAVVAVVGAVVLGRAIRMADRRERGEARQGPAGSDEAVPGRPTLSRPLRGIPRQQRR